MNVFLMKALGSSECSTAQNVMTTITNSMYLFSRCDYPKRHTEGIQTWDLLICSLMLYN